MYMPFMQDVLGVSPVTFEEWLFFLGIALVLIAVMEMYKFVGKFRNNDTSGASQVKTV
jgi:hypothetical protein